jgi:hypothetical protein
MPSKTKFDLEMDDLDLDLDVTPRRRGKKDEPPAIAYTGDPEHDCHAELTAVHNSFKERAQAEAKRFKKATESGHWVCLCFQTQEQADAFARAVAGKPDRFPDGVKIAKKLGIALPADDTPYGRTRIDPTLASLADPL